jgi:hypothetical protein
MSAFKTRVAKLERAADSNRPRVAMVFTDRPSGGPDRVFLGSGVEAPYGTEWRGQTDPPPQSLYGNRAG